MLLVYIYSSVKLEFLYFLRFLESLKIFEIKISAWVLVFITS